MNSFERRLKRLERITPGRKKGYDFSSLTDDELRLLVFVCEAENPSQEQIKRCNDILDKLPEGVR